jgi:hypothetical protein
VKRKGGCDPADMRRLLQAASVIVEAGGTLSDETVGLLADYFQVVTPEEYARGAPLRRLPLPE